MSRMQKPADILFGMLNGYLCGVKDVTLLKSYVTIKELKKVKFERTL